jgi:hypothetical protein
MDCVRKHVDSFLDKIKNRLSFILKNYDFNNSQTWKFLKNQLDILREYIKYSNNRIISVHLCFEFTEVLLILKKNFIDYICKVGPFEISKTEIKLIEKNDYSEYKLPEEFIILFCSYIDTLSKMISKSNLSKILK